MIRSEAPAHRPPRLTWPPLLFALTPSDPSFARQAAYTIDHSAWIPASPEQVYDEFAECTHCDEWVDQFVRFESRTPERPPHLRIYEESFRFMTVRIRMLEAERGPNLFNIEVPDVSHREFVWKRPVYELIRRELRAGLEARERLEERPPASVVKLR